MNTHLRELAERRHALIAEADRQRDRASQAGAGIRAGLAITDRGLAILRHLRRRPIAVGLVAVALTLLIAKPRQAIAWLSYGLSAYAMFERMRRLAAAFLHSDSPRRKAGTVGQRDS